jgi:hypothetical protein
MVPKSRLIFDGDCRVASVFPVVSHFCVERRDWLIIGKQSNPQKTYPYRGALAEAAFSFFGRDRAGDK